MAMSAICCRIACGSQKKVTGLCSRLSGGIFFVQSASITSPGGKPHIRERKPFDYRRKRFTMMHQPFDRTLARMDDNSKIIVIDGPIASGKTEFAKNLAHELDFKFVPQSDIRDLYTCGDAGLSYQDLDELLPPEFRIYDLESFLTDKNPKKLEHGGGRAGQLQLDYFTSRLYTYNDALLHMLSTGQGVVCVRSPHSDRVFAKALFDNGYISNAGFQYYTEKIALSHTIDFPRPHLVIYLDASVEETKENIRRRGNEAEVKSQIFTDEFLGSIEDDYKDVVLPSLENHSELLVYPSIPNITEHEVALMVEDIEALGPLKHSDLSDDYFLDDWRYLRDEELAHKRRDYQDLRLAGEVRSHLKPFSAPEMLKDEYFDSERDSLYDYQPGWKYETSYDPALYPWWKIAMGIRSQKPPADRRKFWIPA